mgnify:CR=1 FL=1
MRKHSYTFSGHSLIQYVTLNSLTNPAWKDRQTYTNPWNENAAAAACLDKRRYIMGNTA